MSKTGFSRLQVKVEKSLDLAAINSYHLTFYRKEIMEEQKWIIIPEVEFRPYDEEGEIVGFRIIEDGQTEDILGHEGLHGHQYKNACLFASSITLKRAIQNAINDLIKIENTSQEAKEIIKKLNESLMSIECPNIRFIDSDDKADFEKSHPNEKYRETFRRLPDEKKGTGLLS